MSTNEKKVEKFDNESCQWLVTKECIDNQRGNVYDPSIAAECNRQMAEYTACMEKKTN